MTNLAGQMEALFSKAAPFDEADFALFRQF